MLNLKNFKNSSILKYLLVYTIKPVSIDRIFILVCLNFFFFTSFSQVGVGTINPDPSAILDITSDYQGILTPRMTTAQRNAIATPANSLLVYDTTLESFYYYDTTPAPGAWVMINSGSNQRNNYKLIKSEADLAPELVAGGGANYLLTPNTLYEINGLITLTAPIDLNDAYVSGRDEHEDILYFPGGVIFQGSTGGSIRHVTLKGAKAFEITGPGSSSDTKLLVQNTIVDSMTTSVGNISAIGVYFANIILYTNNNEGITYSNIDNLLLNNQNWFNTNTGTYETFSGTFDLIQKSNGFSNVLPGNNGMNILGISSITGNADLNKAVFYGGGTYVNGPSPYPGYNFSNDWTVEASGIPNEADEKASANIYYTGSNVVDIINNTPFKLPVTTAPLRLFRTSTRAAPNSSNSIIYEGKKSREINIFANFSFTATGGSRYSFTIYKNGGVVVGSEAIFDVLVTNQRITASVIGTVSVIPGDYIEIYVQKTTAGNEQFLVTSYNLIMN